MLQPSRSSSDSSAGLDTLRKRVGKACDRCRMKKSKCDGTSPCSRCRVDNAICVFGERKKSHDKVYPKGYVEMLEQQQVQLVEGLQDTYRRLCCAKSWPGAKLEETEGHPLTHDILAALEIIDHQSLDDQFEDDTDKLQQRLLSHGASLMSRRGSFSSESDHGTCGTHKRAISVVESPAQSPVPRKRKSVDGNRLQRSPAFPDTSAISQRIRDIQKQTSHQMQPPTVEELQSMDNDILLSSWSWQDLPPEGVPAQEPQFTFPHNGAYNLLESWPGMGSQVNLDPTFMAQYPMGLDPGFPDTAQAQLQNPAFELNSFAPVATI